MGAGAGLLGRATAPAGPPRLEVVVLAAYGWVWGFVYGAIMNLWFWPFVRGRGARRGTRASGSPRRCTTTGRSTWPRRSAWDAAAALTNAVLILLTGRPLLRTLRRFAHRLDPSSSSSDTPSGSGVSWSWSAATN